VAVQPLDVPLANPTIWLLTGAIARALEKIAAFGSSYRDPRKPM